MIRNFIYAALLAACFASCGCKVLGGQPAAAQPDRPGRATASDAAQALAPPGSGEDQRRLGERLGKLAAQAIQEGDSAAADAVLRSLLASTGEAQKRSIREWALSRAMVDGFIQVLGTERHRLSPTVTNGLIAELRTASRSPANPVAAIKATLSRLTRWQSEIRTVDDAIKIAREADRAAFKARLRQALALSRSQEKPGAGLAGEAAEAVSIAERWCLTPGVELEMPDELTHPVAALCLRLIRPHIEAAPLLVQMREENIRLLTLCVRLLASDKLPGSLSGFGPDAASPVTGMPFDYRTTKDGFTLTRPRNEAKR